MRRLILKTEVSLDGFMEGPGGAMDWFETGSGPEWKVLFSLLEGVDTVLLGRVMYPGYASYWREVLAHPKKYPPEHLRYARWADKTPHIVFSKTMKAPDWPCARVERGDLKAVVKALKRGRGGDLIVYGGAKFASALTELGLVDEYNLAVNPVLLGGGKALFGGVKRRRKLRLLRSWAQDSGVVWQRYADATDGKR